MLPRVVGVQGHFIAPEIGECGSSACFWLCPALTAADHVGRSSNFGWVQPAYVHMFLGAVECAGGLRLVKLAENA